MRWNSLVSRGQTDTSACVKFEADVLVAGAGPAGIIAALAAAETGSRVALVEQRGFVGGNLTIGLPILGFLSQRQEQIVRGTPQRLIDRLKAAGAASEHRPCPLHVSITFVDPEQVKSVALEMLVEAGVEVLLHRQVVGVITEGDSIRGILTEGKSGPEAILAKVVVDCTGDADVAWRGGAPCAKGDAQGRMQPGTLMFGMAGVDTEQLRAGLAGRPEIYPADFIPADYFANNDRFVLVGLRPLIEQARRAGLALHTERVILITGLRQGEVWVNMTRVKGVDGTDASSLSAAEIEARRQIPEIQAFLTRYVPGFQKAYLTWTAPFIGIRESRRILGHYVMSREDLLGCRRFEDAIAVGGYPIDLHHPADEGCTLEWCGDCYDIPYRSLVPQRVRNLVVAGRCVSASHEALAALRVMATCMAMGEAAGCAASLAAKQNVPAAEIDVGQLRSLLLARGAYLRT